MGPLRRKDSCELWIVRIFGRYRGKKEEGLIRDVIC